MINDIMFRIGNGIMNWLLYSPGASLYCILYFKGDTVPRLFALGEGDFLSTLFCGMTIICPGPTS